MTNPYQITQQFRDCAEACERAAQRCLETIPYCLEKGGMHSSREHITLVQLCAEMCRTSSFALLTGSKLHTETCRATAAISAACARDCEEMGDDVMNLLAQDCRACSDHCFRMSADQGAFSRSA